MAEAKMQKIAVVTGATSGIGAALVHKLARERYKLVIPCRDASKASRLRASILLHSPRVETDFIPCQLDNLNSVRKCAETVQHRYPVIDLVVANAGVYPRRLELSPQGVERSFAVNHLSHFVLLAWLLPNLYRRTRIVVTGSSAHYKGSADFLGDLGYRKHRFKAHQAYANSKLANSLYACALAGFLREREISCNSVHPGLIATDLVSGSSLAVKLAMPILRTLALKSPEEGAKPLLKLALAPEMAGVSGKFFARMQEATPNPAVADLQLQNQLWETSVQLARKYLPAGLPDSPVSAMQQALTADV